MTSVANVASSICKFPTFWENPPLIQYHVYYPSSKPGCIYVSFKLVELPDITLQNAPKNHNLSHHLYHHLSKPTHLGT